ncbi:hypothetical protein CNYM01_02019 [Colletotrichum nymphaeae SA-01]|uniref:Uncharacterized protein n=1 Tax=Colletotrichum nymphaeae SA-01 TaxID=1460502 RepID=A0A135UWB7_9PEZI|nr:hypothetical protein CNYM01_02019 [Colletotrichum nymphaeae SA-01]
MTSSSSQSYRKFQKLEITVAKARQVGFDYDWDNGLLMFGDYWCMEVERLREILSPDHPGYDDAWDKRDFEADKACLRDKEWFVAQSQYYGLRLGDVKMKTLGNLRRDLAELVKMGACDTLSKPVAAFYEAFREMEDIQKSHDEIFDEFTAMEDKIAFDVEIFAQRYFSDRTTTPAPMSLRNLPSDTRHLMDRLEAIDGLVCRVIDVNDSTYWAIIGWDHQAVDDAVRSARESLKEKSDKAIADGAFDIIATEMQKHHKYVFRNLTPPEIDYHVDGKEFLVKPEATQMRLEDALGNFLVQGIMIEKEYASVDPTVFELNIRPFSSPVEDDGLLVGDMRFGEFEGTAILSFSYDRMAIVQSRHVTQSVGFEMVDGLDTMWKSLSLFKNFSKGDTDEVIREALKAVERPNYFLQPRQNWRLPKLRKPNPWFPHSGARRLYFCAKGWNDAEDSVMEFKKGILDFNPSCTRFKGVITMLENNELFRLKGFKVEDYSPTQWDVFEGGFDDDEDMESSTTEESSISGESSTSEEPSIPGDSSTSGDSSSESWGLSSDDDMT